jgi:antitoxin component YwqK of YwqJK toxin-antitoxin module
MSRVTFDELKLVSGLWVLNGRAYTGTVIFDDPFGGLHYEEEYRNGEQHGLSRAWFVQTGKLNTDSVKRFGVLHGRLRRWHLNGQLAADEQYECGIRVSAQSWDQDGTILEDYTLAESDADYQRLVRYRRWFAEMQGDEAM